MKKIICGILFFSFILSYPLMGADTLLDTLKNPESFSSYNKSNVDRLKKLSRDFEKAHPFTPNDVPIDVFITTVAKDLPVLGYCVYYARHNILHPIGNIYIVAPASRKIKAFCQDHSCVFVDESKVLPIRTRDITYFPQGVDRRGWLFQQLLKLNCDKVCANENILVLDSDTMLVRPQSFRFDSRTLLEYSDKGPSEALQSYEKLFFEKPKAAFSFNCQQMMFEKSKLRIMKEVIEFSHRKKWYEAILDEIDQDSISGFSEYETYGNFFLANFPDEFFQLHFFNLSLTREEIPAMLIGKIFQMLPYKKFTKSVSFHSSND